MMQSEVTEKELIRILILGEMPLKIYALKELHKHRMQVPFHELEPVISCTNEDFTAALICYGQLLSPDERVKMAEHLIQSPNPVNLRGVINLLTGCRYPTEILKFLLQQIPCCSDLILKRDLIWALQPHISKLPQAFFQPLLRHPSPSIALTVIKLLAANPKTSFRALLEEAQAHHEPRIRATALVGLWKLGDPSLVEQTSSQTCSKTLELYIRALGFTGPDPTVQNLLESLSLNSNIAIRYAAYLSLGKVGRKDQVPEILLRAVEEFSLPVCSAMIRTCLKLNEDETIRTLLNLFELYSEAEDTDSIEKINYFIELTPHHAAALKIVTSLKDSRSIHESQHREGETSLDLNLIQDLVDHLQRGSHKSNLAVKNNVQSLNRFEFLELLG